LVVIAGQEERATSRARKISEGMPVLLGMMGRDSVSSEQQLEDQQWVVESRRFAPGQKSLGRLEQAGARRARSNIGIIAAYQKTMAERVTMAEEENGVDRRREVEKGEEVIEEMERELEEEEKEGSLEDLPVFERQTKGRATVCLGDMKPRVTDGGGQEVKEARGHEGPQVQIGRSQSLRRPFKRIGDGLAKTLRQLKKK